MLLALERNKSESLKMSLEEAHKQLEAQLQAERIAHANAISDIRAEQRAPIVGNGVPIGLQDVRAQFANGAAGRRSCERCLCRLRPRNPNET